MTQAESLSLIAESIQRAGRSILPAPVGAVAVWERRGGDPPVQVLIVGYKEGNALVDDGNGKLCLIKDHPYESDEYLTWAGVRRAGLAVRVYEDE